MITFSTSRSIPANREQVFSAISNPTRLARWWGPEGFTNDFAICEFKTGGRWTFDMIGPDGKQYPNDSVFAEIEVPSKVVVQHTSEPQFLLTIVLTESPEGTLVTWNQAFENEDVARKVEAIVVPSNEQNLDRLTNEVTQTGNEF